jgi:UDP-glucose 4-epimerase
MKNILVTGGCGYIGSHTVVELLNNNYKVVVFDNLENSKKEVLKKVEDITGKKVDFYRGDLKKSKDIKGVFSNYKIDGVIHFAAYKSVTESVKNPLNYFGNNVIGTFNILQVMRSYKVHKIVFSSSAAVYGNPREIPVTEDGELNPLSPYGRNKLCMEFLLSDCLNIGIDSVPLRYFNAAGAHSSGEIGEDPNAMGNLIPRVYKATQGGYHLEIRGDKYDTRDGSAIRDYVHVMDLAEGHVKALKWLEQNKNVNEVFNLCSGTGTTVLEIVKGLKKVTKREVDYEIVDSNPNEAEIVTGSYNKAEEILNWKPKRDINETLEDVCRWYENNK